MKLSRNELTLRLTGILRGCEFEPRDGALAEGEEIAIQFIPMPLGRSGVCHLMFELLPPGEYEPVRVRLRQTAETGAIVTREAVSDSAGRTGLRYVLMDRPCAVEILPAPGPPPFVSERSGSYTLCERLAGPPESATGECSYRTISPLERRSHPQIGVARRDREEPGFGKEKHAGSPYHAEALPEPEVIAFQAAGEAIVPIEYVDATTYQPIDRKFAVVLEQTAEGRTVVTVTTDDPTLKPAGVRVRLGSESHSRTFTSPGSPARQPVKNEAAEARLGFNCQYKSAVALSLSIDFYLPG